MRPMALIRDLLVLRLIQDAVRQEERRARGRLRDAAVELVDVEDRELDVRVRFRVHGWEHEVMYPRAMLTAETKALLQTWRRWSRERQ
ncbi:MAG: hypothetical protein K6T26_05325 [Alicyclobacillus sp.]|nr:hypothetical protein [Alicyclobacillus sp.]